MATLLRGLRLNRCDLVDDPANPKARVVLHKRADALADSEKENDDMNHQKSLWKKFTEFVAKEAGALVDWAGQEESEHMGVFHQKMCKALEGLAPEHPAFGVLKEMGDYIAMRNAPAPPANEAPAAEGSEAPPAPAESEAAPMPDFAKSAAVDVNKSIADAVAEAIAKRDVEHAARLAETEQVLKSERDAVALASHVAELRKFAHVSVNPEADAPVFKRLAETDRSAYDRVIELLKSADAVTTTTAANGPLTTEIGSPMPGDASTSNAWAQIEAQAAELAKEDKRITKAKAISIVMEKRPDLVKRHTAEVMSA